MHSIMKWIRYDQQFFSSCCNDLGLWKNWSNILYVANILGLLLRLEQKLFCYVANILGFIAKIANIEAKIALLSKKIMHPM